ncbi:MAG: tRNA uridine-5-carboxymethylaminomethyl(34) synthesis GTPase MnmE [Sphingomonadaceae bacterium]
MYDDTIAAISTSAGEAGIGIVRISGRDAVPILRRVFRKSVRGGATDGGGGCLGPGTGVTGGDATRCGAGEAGGTAGVPFESHRVYYGQAVDPATGAPIDEVLVFCMLAPRSYTREDVVEIHCHGGAVPLRRVLLAVLQAGARPAQPGEFTLRAYLNGRIDLAQAEAVVDVIRSRTEKGLAVAVKGLSGHLSGRVRAIRKELLRLLAYLEATIDFEEDDVPEEDVDGPLAEGLDAVRRLLATADQGIVCRQGIRVAIVGRPNVGKSSLLNALLRSDRAIVTEIAGTTRDTLEETANLGGVPVCLVDTAGIAETRDPVERLGIERSRKAIEEADLCLMVVDRSVPLLPEDRSIAASVACKVTILVANKSDLPPVVTLEGLQSLVPGSTVVETSAVGGEGLEALVSSILDVVFSGQVVQSDELLVSNPRHKGVLMRVETHLRDALSSRHARLPADCTASDLRAAVDALGEITGETATEELLDTIFSRFCVGK